MDSAQTKLPQNIPSQVPPMEISPLQTELPISPIKKFLPFIIIGVILLIIVASGFVLLAGRSSTQTVNPTPTVRPTATPIIAPTMPEASPTPKQATPASEIKNKLVFIKDGDIYESDLFSTTLLIKNKTAAGDKLAWSPKGNFLSWRPKSTTGLPNAITVYERSTKSPWDIKPNTEIIDYAWAPNEKQLALALKDNTYNISLYGVATSSGTLTKLITRETPIKQILWPSENTLIFSGEDGISSLAISSPSAKLLISNKNVQSIKLSPIGNKILYSVGTNEKSDLYLINIDGNFNQLLKIDTNKVDMGETGIPANVVDNGFTLDAIFFPKGDRLMVGVKYMTGLPVSGIYDLKDKSFKAIAAFPLSNQDLLIHDWLLLGPRVVISSGKSSWQISLFTMEEGAKLSTIRTIPEALSPAYFGTYEDNQFSN